MLKETVSGRMGFILSLKNKEQYFLTVLIINEPLLNLMKEMILQFELTFLNMVT